MAAVTFWKFVDHEVKMTRSDAAERAAKIEHGEYKPRPSYGERFYKLGGWCFDIGRKPFLYEAHGSINRALSIKELREVLHLGRSVKVVADPLFAMEQQEEEASL